MVTIGGVSSAGAAATYFAKDNYYTKEQGLGESEWFGKGAEELGLIEVDVIDVDDVDESGSLETPNKDLEPADKPLDTDSSLDNLDREDIEVNQSELDSGDTAEIDKTAEVGPEAKEPEQSREESIDPILEPSSVEPEQGENIKVDASDFKAVLEGRTEDGQRIGYEDKEGNWKHVPGKDMVFAPSKSVSVMALVGGDKRLISAYEDSVKSTLAYAERNFASVQDTKGEKKAFKTGNITVGLFTHDTSRNQDPLLHVHAVIANMTKDPRTDQWRALNKRALYKNVYKLNKLHMADFAKRVQKLGYSITEGKHGNFEIDAVPQNVRDEFSSRRMEIVEAMDGREGNFKQRRTATLDTRAAKTELPRGQLSASWLDRAEVLGFNPKDHIPAPVRSVFLEGAKNRLAVNEAIEHLTYNQTTTSKTDIVAHAMAHPRSGGDIEAIERQVEAAEAGKQIVIHSVHSSNAETNYTTKAQIDAEQGIRKLYTGGIGARPIAANNYRLRKNLAKTHYINGRAVTLNETQNAAMHHVLTSPDKYIGIQGLAGVGKTTALGVAVTALKQTAFFNPFIKSPKIIGMAPTIAAANELAEKTGGTDSTVQKYVKQHKHLLSGKYQPSRKSIATYKGSVILHDESSMLSNQMQLDFMKINEVLGVSKVIFIGDTGQHGSVQAGPAFRMLQDFGMKTATMNQIMRQKNDKLLSAAIAFSNHEFHKGFNIIADYIHEGSEYIKNAAEHYLADREDSKQTALMSMDNKTRKSLNEAVRLKMKERNLLGAKDEHQTVMLPTYLSPVQAAYSNNYSSNDKLEFRQDIYNRPIEAGDIWSVSNIDNERNRLTLTKGGQEVQWDLTKLKEQPFEHLREDTLKLSENDEVRFKQKSDEHDIKREQTGEIMNIDNSTMTIKLSDNRTLTMARDDKLAARLDHSYTSTTYNMQGKTTANGIGVIDPFSRAANGEAMSVMGTRSEHTLDIYTSDTAQMRSQIESNDSGDQIASHAIGLTASERIEPHKAEIKEQQAVRDQVRDQVQTRTGIER